MKKLWSLVASFIAVSGAREAYAAPPPLTDPEILLDSLRPSVKAALPRKELPPLAQLPRYELSYAVADDLQGYALDERVAYTNTTRSPQPYMVLRLFANSTRTPAPITYKDVSCAPRPCVAAAESPSAIRITPDAAIRPGETLEVSLHLDGKLHVTPADETSLLSQSLSGLSALFGGAPQQTDYGLLGYADDIASLAHAFAVVAKQDKNGFVDGEKTTMGDLGTDEMSFVHAKLKVPSNASVAATGVVVRDGAADGIGYYTVSAGMVRDFAVLVSRGFTSATRKVGDVAVRSHFLVRDQANGERALDVAATALATFERRFGAYPYRNLDVVEAPVVGGAGGVEFSGLVTVASMFYRPKATDSGILGKLLAGMGPATDSLLEFTTAHEVGHQYWHGLVGSDSREHPFLDESLAQFSALLYVEDRYGKARAAQDGDMQVRMNYRAMRLLGKKDGAVDQPVDTFQDPLRYAGLVYGKGEGFFERARALMGDAAFFEALRRYVGRFGFRTATPAGLREELCRNSRHAPALKQLARHWLDETHGDEDFGSVDPAKLLQSFLGSGDASGLAGLLGGTLPEGATGKGGAGLQKDIQKILRGAGAPDLDRIMQMIQDMDAEGTPAAP